MISGLTSYSQDPLNEPFFRRKVIFEPSKDDDSDSNQESETSYNSHSNASFYDR